MQEQEQNTKNTVTLESLSIQLERLEKKIDAQAKQEKKHRDWKDLQELAGLALLVIGLGYLIFTGGLSALFEWVKGMLLP